MDVDSYGDYNFGCIDEINEIKFVIDLSIILVRVVFCIDGNVWEIFLNYFEYENSLELL